MNKRTSNQCNNIFLVIAEELIVTKKDKILLDNSKLLELNITRQSFSHLAKTRTKFFYSATMFDQAEDKFEGFNLAIYDHRPSHLLYAVLNPKLKNTSIPLSSVKIQPTQI